MSSSALDLSTARPPLRLTRFMPSRDTLDRILALEAPDATRNVPRAEREAAFARSRQFTPAGAPSDAMMWSSGSVTIATQAIAATAADATGPALATDVLGGVLHMGAIQVRRQAERHEYDGCIITSFAQARVRYPELVAQLPAVDGKNLLDRAAALAVSFQNCGAFVYVPPGKILEKPIQLVWTYGDGREEAVFPRIAVVLGAGAQATIIERHLGDGDVWVCGHLDVRLAAGAQLDYVVIQRLGENAKLQMNRQATCAERALLRWHDAELGSGNSRTRIGTALVGAAAQVETYGMSLHKGLQRAEMIVRVAHQAPGTHSRLVNRTALGERARSIVKTELRFGPRAGGSVAAVKIAGLLFSRRAQMRILPQRKAQNQNVRLEQAIEIGSFDEEAYFYILCRGLPHKEALRMIALAFFEPAIQHAPTEILRDEIRTALDDDIDQATTNWR